MDVGNAAHWPIENTSGWLTTPPGRSFYSFTLIKTGPLGVGRTLTGLYGRATVSDTGTITQVRSFYFRGFTINVAAEPVPTCGFRLAPNPVNLGLHDTRTFTGVGATTPWLPLNVISEGCNAATTQVHMTWRGTADANNNGLFRVTTGDIRGVGIEVQRTTGAAIVPNGARQTWTPAANGVNYPHRARFRQTLPTITQGTGSTAITIGFTYN
nr:fimbrial protein [Collimonas sp. OK607]